MPDSAPSVLDLVFVSDALLALVGGDAAAPYRREDAFEERAKRLAHRERSVDGDPSVVLVSESEGFLLAAEVRDVIRRARLTARQTEVFDLRLLGMTFEEIGARRRTTKQGAMRVFTQGLAKVGRAASAYRYLGLGECHDEDVRRRGCRRRR